jgi:hypothetical protein
VYVTPCSSTEELYDEHAASFFRIQNESSCYVRNVGCRVYQTPVYYIANGRICYVYEVTVHGVWIGNCIFWTLTGEVCPRVSLSTTPWSDRLVRLTSPPSVSQLSRFLEDVGASTSTNPIGLHGLLRGRFYLFYLHLSFSLLNPSIHTLILGLTRPLT